MKLDNWTPAKCTMHRYPDDRWLLLHVIWAYRTPYKNYIYFFRDQPKFNSSFCTTKYLALTFNHGHPKLKNTVLLGKSYRAWNWIFMRQLRIIPPTVVRFPSYNYANCSVALLQLDPGSSAAARAKVGAWRRWRSLTPMQQSAWERGIDSHRGSLTVQDSWLL